MIAPEEAGTSNAKRARWALWVAVALALCIAGLMGVRSCFYAPPTWHRIVEQSRHNPYERRLAIVMTSTLWKLPRGLATFPDGGIAITLRQVRDVWICDPESQTASRIATFRRPTWCDGQFGLWIIDWQTRGDRSSLYLRLSGTKGRGTGARNLVQHVRIEFDRNSAEHSRVVYLDSPRTQDKSVQDFVNPKPEYGIMSVRQRDDTLLVWTDRSPDSIARFLIDKVGGRVSPLGTIPKRVRSSADSSYMERLARERVCPENIRGIISPSASRLSLGSVGLPPLVTATITRVDVSCTKRRHDIVGNDRDGDVEFFILASAWIEYDIADPERYERTEEPVGATVVVEAMSKSGDVLGSDSMGFTAYKGGKYEILHLQIQGMKPEDIARVTRVVARWNRVGSAR